MSKEILQWLDKGLRFDGRKDPLDYREVKVTYDVSNSAEGSATVQIGDTVVMAGVKMSMGTPYSDKPDEGSITVNAELLPLSSPEFDPGPPAIQAIELARVVDRGIRESKTLDFKKLCIEPGEKIWMVNIDIISINDAGNLFDAGSLAALAAVKSAKFPALDGDVVDYGTKTDKVLEMASLPLGVTVLKVGKHFIVDPSSEEEAAADARLTVASTEDGSLCAMQKGGATALTVEEIDKMIEIAVDKAKMLREKL